MNCTYESMPLIFCYVTIDGLHQSQSHIRPLMMTMILQQSKRVHLTSSHYWRNFIKTESLLTISPTEHVIFSTTPSSLALLVYSIFMEFTKIKF